MIRKTGLWGILLSLTPTLVFAQSDGGVSLNLTANAVFLGFMVVTIIITYWAAKHTHSTRDYYAASGGIPAWQNGVAIAGDFISAATFFGITAALYGVGFDGLLFIAPVLAAWPIILFLIAERLRNLGRFTFVDVVSFRLAEEPIRKVAAVASLFVVIFYLIGQIVAAGKLIELLFPLNYTVSVIVVCALMTFYVTFGGMLATTWVQFIKAVLLVLGTTIIGVLLLIHYDFDLNSIFQSAAEAHPKGEYLFEPGGAFPSRIGVLSLATTLVLGFIGLPHVLMRLFTVKDGKAARKSAFYATAIMGYVYVFIILIGFGAVSVIMDNPNYHEVEGGMIGGSNMMALHLTHFLGGDALLGFMSAVAFATILAVVAGLTLAGAAAVAHDIYGQVICRGQPDEKKELRISRITVLSLGVISIFTALAFENQNIVFLATAALSISASVNAPVLLLAMFWKPLTTRGAVAGVLAGLVSSLLLIILGPFVWVNVFGNDDPIFPYRYPTVFSATLAFIAAYVFSVSDTSNRSVMDHRKFDDQFIRSETGLGLDDAAEH